MLTLTYKGFDYVAFYNGAYENADSLPALAATGANSVELTLDYGIDADNSTVVADPNYTDSLAALGNAIVQSESLGLSVMVRPLIDFLNPSEIGSYTVGEWRQDYQPTNIANFFASYEQMIVAEAKVAQQDGAQMLSIGAELDQLTGTRYLSYWTNIIDAVRDVFTGKLTYSASWNTANEVSFWNQLDYEGIDNYIPLSNAQNPTLQDLINGWTQPATATSNPGAYEYIGNQSPIQYFENLAEQSGRPLIFTELGYSNAVGAASDPAALGTTPDPSLQAELYQAFFDAWSQAGAQSLVGTYFWEWDPNNSTSNVGPNIVSFSPENNPAQTVAANEFSLVPPTINVNSNITIGENQSITAASLITSISNPSDDSITQEGFLDQGGGSGYFAVNGVAQPDGTWIYPTDPNSVAYVGGTSPGTDTLEVGIYDATAYSYFYSTAISAITTAPTTNPPSTGTTASIAINPIDGNNIINAGEAAAGVTIGGIESNADGQTVTVDLLNSSNAIVESYTATAAAGAWSASVTAAQAQALTNGSYKVTANVSNQYGSAASQASQVITVHDTSPKIAINPVDGNNIITTAEAAAGVTIGGTESNADGQTVTVDLLNSSSTVVDSYTATAAAGAWSVSVTAAQALALADDSYTVTANASDQYGNPAPRAAQAVAVIPSVPGNVDEWLLSNGQWAASAEPGSHPSGYSVAGVGDFTGSSTDGILWYNASTGDTDEWKISGGAYAGSVDLGAHPGNFQIAGVGDFTGNGTDDVLWTSSGNGQVQTDIWELSGGQWAASVSPGSHPAGYQVAGIGDFTGTGTDDILWLNPTTGDVDEWQLSNGQWAASVDLGAHPGSGWQIAGVGDFTGNGISDILWTNSGNGQVQTDIWELGSNGQWVASVSPGSHPAGYQVAGIGDFTGNGTSDILWQNSATGDIDEWQIAGGQWAASVDLGAHPGNTPVSGVGNFTGSGTSDILFHTNGG